MLGMVLPGTASHSSFFQSLTSVAWASSAGVSCSVGTRTRSRSTPSTPSATSEKLFAIPLKISQSLRDSQTGSTAADSGWMKGCMSDVLSRSSRTRSPWAARCRSRGRSSTCGNQASRASRACLRARRRASRPRSAGRRPSPRDPHPLRRAACPAGASGNIRAPCRSTREGWSARRTGCAASCSDCPGLRRTCAANRT